VPATEARWPAQIGNLDGRRELGGRRIEQYVVVPRGDPSLTPRAWRVRVAGCGRDSPLKRLRG
jgi:hypothetical protein